MERLLERKSHKLCRYLENRNWSFHRHEIDFRFQRWDRVFERVFRQISFWMRQFFHFSWPVRLVLGLLHCLILNMQLISQLVFDQNLLHSDLIYRTGFHWFHDDFQLFFFSLLSLVRLCQPLEFVWNIVPLNNRNLEFIYILRWIYLVNMYLFKNNNLGVSVVLVWA